MLLSRENRLGRGVVFLISFSLFFYPFFSDFRSEARAQVDPRSKITFTLEHLNASGLYGPPYGLRALHYEFCIPADAELEAQVRQIDSTIQIFKNSPGRVGCTKEENLCVGNTHQPEFRMVLYKLANLPYVKRIDQAFFE